MRVTVGGSTDADLAPPAWFVSEVGLEPREVSIIIKIIVHSGWCLPGRVGCFASPSFECVGPVEARPCRLFLNSVMGRVGVTLLPPVHVVHERALLHVDAVVLTVGPRVDGESAWEKRWFFGFFETLASSNSCNFLTSGPFPQFWISRINHLS